MGQVTHEQANLLLRLYELRRESRLREARAWFYSHFEAGTPEELLTKYPMGSAENASLRMVITYWDMAAGLANRGLIDDVMFFENSAEGWIVWEKMKAIVPAQRTIMKNPAYLAHLENFAKRYEAWRERTAPGSLEAFRQARANARRAAAKSAS
ncbi:MAG: hypothetical protein LAN18_03265 [Acidobacteriia bacterium]|nr:hypothetical protein [Terriglobia bacterium]